MTAEEVVRLLGLVPLPGEGGWYAETGRSVHRLPAAALPDGYRSPRASYTAIYYLLDAASASALHRLPGDEVWHFYRGDPVELLVVPASGEPRLHRLGPDLARGERPQVTVPGGAWQGARLAPGGAWALLGTTMAPGFEFDDWEAGDPEALAVRSPRVSAWLRSRSFG